MSRGRSVLWVVLGALMIAICWRELAQIHAVLRDAHPTRDYAIYEINVRRALEGKQWLGPYAQWFHHLGPSYFYWLALPYVFAGKTTFSLYAAAQILSLSFVLASAVVLCRWTASAAPALLFVPMFAFEMGYLGDFPLFDFWPPYVMFFGYGLFLVLCAGLAAGHVTALAPTVAVASLLVQTHVSYAPAVMLGGGLVAAYWIRSGVVATPGVRMHLGVALAVLLVLWAPPIYSELSGRTRNFGRLFHVFFETRARSHSLSALLDRVALELSGAWQYALFRDSFIVPEAPKHYGAARGIALAQLAALVAGWRRSRQLGDRFSEALCALCIASIGAASFSLTKIRGDVAPHHTAWISILGFVGTLAAASGLWSPRSQDFPPRPLVRMTALAAAWAVLVSLRPIAILRGPHENSEVGRLASSVTDALRRERLERPRIAWGGTQDAALSIAEYDWAGAVMLELEKRGIPFFIHESADLRWMIGAPRWEGWANDSAVVTLTVGSREGLGRKIDCVESGENYFMKYPVCVWLSER